MNSLPGCKYHQHFPCRESVTTLYLSDHDESLGKGQQKWAFIDTKEKCIFPRLHSDSQILPDISHWQAASWVDFSLETSKLKRPSTGSGCASIWQDAGIHHSGYFVVFTLFISFIPTSLKRLKSPWPFSWISDIFAIYTPVVVLGRPTGEWNG